MHLKKSTFEGDLMHSKTYRNISVLSSFPFFSVDKQRLFLVTDELCRNQLRNKKCWFSNCSLSMPNFYNVAIVN